MIVAKKIAEVSFCLLLGASSGIGIESLASYVITDKWFIISSACFWSVLLVVLYSTRLANQEKQLIDTKINLEHIKMIKNNVIEPKAKKTKFSKIEIQHTMDPNASNIPAFLKKDTAFLKKDESK
jgi:hypothetical protein